MLADNLTTKSLAKRFRKPTECEFPLSMYNIFFLSFFHESLSLRPHECVWFSAIVSLVDAHKFIIRNLSSSETLNRIKDNKLEISGWTIYDCWRFHVHEKKTKWASSTAHGHASFQISHMSLWIKATANSKRKLKTIGILQETNK